MILETKSLHLEFCDKTGALTALTAKDTNWQILNRPELGLSWRLMVPLGEELRNNDVLGEKQKLTSAKVDKDQVTFVWDNPVSERGGLIDCTITLTVRAEGRQAVYDIAIDNRSAYTIENVYCPYLGDLQHPPGDEGFKRLSYNYATTTEQSIWPTFANNVGYYGADYPTMMSGNSPNSPYTLLHTPSQGLYVGVRAHDAELVSWMLELRPGWDSSINSMVPKQTDISGKPVHTRFAALHVPYIMPGEHRRLTPVALEAYRGNWQKGVDIYKAWRDTWMTPAVAPDWAKNPHAWLQIHINSPEDELRMRFVDLPKVAAECKKHGVAAIQLVGWNDGGQDQGNPSHDHDPRLGTLDELKTAIKACQAMGVKVIIFTKFVWADRATKWFREDLHRLAVKDPYGDYYVYPGYRYQTGTQLLDINTKRLIPMCFLSEEYLDVCQAEMQKVVDLGADGMLFDESLHHSPTLLCFAPDHGHRYGAPTYQNDRELIRRFWKIPNIQADFLMAGEACYDWEMEAYQLSYHRSENKKHVALSRYMLPRAQFMTAVTGFDDRNMINQCLLCRYVISYEPYNFKGSLEDFPLTVAYGKTMDALRTECRKWFWDGEYRDTCEATVTNQDGTPHPTYAVFKAADNSLGVVICNYEDQEICVTCTPGTGNPFVQYRIVGEADWQQAQQITIPARSAAVVV